MACSCVGYQDLAKDVGRALGRRLALPGPVGQSAPAHSVHLLERPPWKYWPPGELFSFLIKEPVVASNDVSSNRCVSAETLKACALIGLHLVAAEGEAGSSGSPSRDSGDMWRERLS